MNCPYCNNCNNSICNQINHNFIYYGNETYSLVVRFPKYVLKLYAYDDTAFLIICDIYKDELQLKIKTKTPVKFLNAKNFIDNYYQKYLKLKAFT